MEDIEDCRPDEPNLPPKRIENVGEEFMDWAEKYWSFKRIVRKGISSLDMGESCPYDFYRQYFVNKINQLVEDKISQL